MSDGGDGSYAIRAKPTFYMYEGPGLDHGWMHACPGFTEWATGVRMQNTAEIGAHTALSRETARRQRVSTRRGRTSPIRRLEGDVAPFKNRRT